MTPQEARELLLLHSYSHPNLHHAKMDAGFLGSLRPFQGLNEDNFHEVMEALQTLAPELAANDVVDREIMSALWDICWQASLIGLHSTGALQRNQKISSEEIDRLEEWVFDISFAVSILLATGDVNEAFASYKGRTAG